MTSWNKSLNIRNPISQIYYYHKNSGDSELLAVSQNKLNKVIDGNLTSVTGILTSDSTKFVVYKDRKINDAVLIADKGRLKVYNGSSVSEVTPHVPTDGTNGTPAETTDPGVNDLINLTNFRTFAIKKDRIFAAAHPTVKNRVSFCYFDPYLGYAVYDYWPAIYFFDVATEDNDEIVELRAFRNTLIILCKRSAWVLTGDGATLLDYQLTKINVPKGCISQNSVQEVGNNLFYLGDDHIYSLFSTEQEYISAQIVSDAIGPILKSISLVEKSQATSIFHDNKYYLSFPSGLTLVYDITLEQWTKYTNIKATGFVVIDNELYFSADDGFIYKFNENVYSDDGEAIAFMMKTKIIDFDLPVNMKKIRRMWLVMKQYQGSQSSFDLHATIDQYTLINLNNLGVDDKKGLGAIWDVSKWDEALWDFSEILQQMVKIRKKGKSIQVQIENSNVDEPCSVYGIVIEYEIKKPK
ncbi:hypothetical protein [Heyndrickxia camelliae]|uniref:Uncharacterized protein n=1 Tax=Heyndrickxia camelliae TaxID=1707093 RepID=A0A2N3LNA9_9BACI|nr:hypothetical protein [Heyndrickxia camelliae]PKR86096.1 hypothetical protein CWO92_06915 [Heyndrickxia camelliae]